MTTTIQNNIDELFSHKMHWKHILNLKYIVKNDEHHQMMTHYIDINQYKNNMNMLKNKIKTYNFIKLKMIFKWLIKQTMNDDKTHISILITLNKINETQLFKNDLFIKNIKIKTNMFNFIKYSHQCKKCMKFEHAKTNYKNVITCNFCSLKNKTNNHKYNKCNVMKKLFNYINFKCINYNENKLQNYNIHAVQKIHCR